MVQHGLTTKEPSIQKRTLELTLNIQRTLTLNQSKQLMPNRIPKSTLTSKRIH